MRRALFIALLCLGTILPAQAAEPAEGVDYELLPPPAAAPAGTAQSPVSVVYVFSHYCGACGEIAERLDRWLAALPAGVVAHRVIAPISNQAGREPANDTYQALRQLGVAPAADRLLFTRLARGTGAFQDREELLAWLAKSGIAVAGFDSTARSFAVAAQISRTNAALRRLMASRGSNIPVAIVDDRYLVPLWATGQLDRRLAILDALVARARAERAGSAGTASR